MKGKVCIITGANSGIGKETTRGLAKMGASVVMVCRDPRAGEAAQSEIVADCGNDRVDLLMADLSSQAAVRQLAREFESEYKYLHVLINNAGVAPINRSMTEDGIETTFAVNYLAPFLLTNLLLDVLKASAPARVINVAGDHHRRATINFDDLMSEKDYSGIRANNQAKLALILFTYELSRKLAGSAVSSNCLHPGAVATDSVLKDPDLPTLSRLLYKLVRIFFISPARGAETSIYLASSPEVEGLTGKYFINKAPVRSSTESYDEEVAKRIWGVSEQLTGLVS